MHSQERGLRASVIYVCQNSQNPTARGIIKSGLGCPFEDLLFAKHFRDGFLERDDPFGESTFN